MPTSAAPIRSSVPGRPGALSSPPTPARARCVRALTVTGTVATAQHRQRYLSGRQHLRRRLPARRVQRREAQGAPVLRRRPGDRPTAVEHRKPRSPAPDHLRRITPRVVSLKVQDTDRYGRKVAEVIDPATGTVINRAMVEAGQAAVYRRYCKDGSYSRAEAGVKAAGLGIWSKGGEQQRPWEYRRG
nr:thermonuclease family protein [Lamprobacter modestohalophilus]